MLSRSIKGCEKYMCSIYLNTKYIAPYSNKIACNNSPNDSSTMLANHQIRSFSMFRKRAERGPRNSIRFEDLERCPEKSRFVLWTNGDNCPETGTNTRLAKILLEANGKEYEEIRIPKGSNLSTNAMNNFDSADDEFPKIYISQEHLGGINDLKAYLYM